MRIIINCYTGAMTTPNTLIHVHSVHFSYAQEEILHGVSLTINKGEILAITGANGSGKSTLLELIAGVMLPSHGHIERPVPVALVVQRPNTPPALPLSVADVVAMGTWHTRSTRIERNRVVAQGLERVGLSGFERRNFSTLSGGQRQRALVAQGLVQQTPVLLLDEPLASLDTSSRDAIHKILRAEADHGLAVVLVTHDHDSQMLADRTITLRDGAIAQRPIPSLAT